MEKPIFDLGWKLCCYVTSGQKFKVFRFLIRNIMRWNAVLFT